MSLPPLECLMKLPPYASKQSTQSLRAFEKPGHWDGHEQDKYQVGKNRKKQNPTKCQSTNGQIT